MSSLKKQRTILNNLDKEIARLEALPKLNKRQQEKLNTIKKSAESIRPLFYTQNWK